MKSNISIVGVDYLSQNSASVTIISDQVAPFVFIETGIQGRWSDNGFLLFKNEAKKIVFNGWENFSISQLKDSIRVSTLSDTF